MKRHLAGLVFVLFAASASAQQIQWASKVIGYSSQLTPVQYSAEQILGKPNVLPAGGQNPNAWTPDKPKRSEYITVGFATPMQIEQIAVAESYNPGALYKVYAYDEAGKEYLINTLNPTSVPLQGRVLNVFMQKTPYKVAAVKLEFDGKAVPDYFSIDAVAIADVNYPIIADIALPDLLAKGLLIERLDEAVNSTNSELNPLLSPDGKTLYFSRKNHPQNAGGVNDKEDIWFSELGADGKWSLAKNLGPQVNNEYPNFVNAVSSATPDGKAVVLVLGNQYLANGKMLAGISTSNNIAGMWSEPEPIIIENDYNFNEKANYFLANTRKTLLMSIEREDARGSRDIYVSFQKSDSTWTQPLNLGTNINTAGEESSPFLASDDKTLYFASNGYSGFGGSDIYMSRRLDDTWTNWSPAENLGPDINSKEDDTFFNIPSTSDYAYYSRTVSPDNADIYRVKLPLFVTPDPIIIVRGKLIDATTGKPIGAKIIYERLPDGKEVGVTQSNPETGEYEIHLPGGYQYGFRAEAKDHLSENQNLDLRNNKKDNEVVSKDITLAPIGVTTLADNAKITLNNIFFDFDKAVLKQESYPELNRIAGLMKERATMQVEIAGHADATGPEDYNLNLSKRRAQAVANYLSTQGIDAQRITVTYYGEAKPVERNDTAGGRKKNRRVEFIILKLQ
ncbi:MAG: OmpA family protein [Cyclobacteriaceae bacterium]|jgi:outer membrane protein OmpA-like peptidoglycan-associated protein|nr:OmpA family protein [Cyclobacteriaceae bacterium]